MLSRLRLTTCAAFVLSFLQIVSAVKFELVAEKYPRASESVAIRQNEADTQDGMTYLD